MIGDLVAEAGSAVEYGGGGGVYARLVHLALLVQQVGDVEAVEPNVARASASSSTLNR